MSETLSALSALSATGTSKPSFLLLREAWKALPPQSMRCRRRLHRGKRFSARSNAANFSDNELEEAAGYCHLHGVKLYRAMNTVVFPEETNDFLSEAEKSAAAGIDGLIVQDLGMARLLREVLPDMKLNASTQMTIHTAEGARLASELGFSRVVAARELSVKELEKIIATGVETEVFIHGALCMSVSGQCYMSAMIGSRSANRGLCAQACRLPFGGL